MTTIEAPRPTDLSGNPGRGVSRVLRGGAWYADPGGCRAASRYYDRPGYRGYVIGFRVCRGAPIETLAAASLITGSPNP